MISRTLAIGLAAIFAGIAVVMAVLGFTSSLFLLFVALPFALASYALWYHGTGRLQSRWRRRSPRGAATSANRSGERARRGGGRTRRDERRARDGDERGGREHRRNGPSGPTIADAYRILDLDPGADDAAIRRAYRERVKLAHPDADGGSEDEFKRVTAAYERLTHGR